MIVATTRTRPLFERARDVLPAVQSQKRLVETDIFEEIESKQVRCKNHQVAPKSGITSLRLKTLGQQRRLKVRDVRRVNAPSRDGTVATGYPEDVNKKGRGFQSQYETVRNE